MIYMCFIAYKRVAKLEVSQGNQSNRCHCYYVDNLAKSGYKQCLLNYDEPYLEIDEYLIP